MKWHKVLIFCSLLLCTAAVATAQESQTVTLADNGRTITLNVNETFLLKLGENFDWNITIDDPAIFSRVVNVLVVRGAQGIYIAHKPGSATLTAVGSPECLKSKPPCGMPSILFRVNVVVQGQEQVQNTPAFEALAAVIAMLAAILARRR
ncbi:Uncharacterised protein [uncultured archaeon]|nr:Uncharacterised protein [uncultured archaeon]